jgi:DNA repair exonuclease SbcCD nuclease subunit
MNGAASRFARTPYEITTRRVLIVLDFGPRIGPREKHLWGDKVLRIIHTSDLQIGKAFRYVDEATQSVLQDARLDTIARIGRLARDEAAAAVLVAGDIYDIEGLSTRTLEQPLERMRQAEGVEWHLIPGNHDPHRPNGLWDRLMRKGLPANVTAHLEPRPTAIAAGSASLLPAPLTRMHALSDLTEWMVGAETPAGALRIGLGHGSITQFGSDDTTTHNYIDPTRPQTARLDYLGLGDWHGTKRINDRVWYSGTHETDAFDVEGGGNALVVDLPAPGAVPKVTVVPVGRFKWATIPFVVNAPEDIDILEERLRGTDADPSRVLVELNVSGALNLAERRMFETRIVDSTGAALKWLRLDDSKLVLTPTDEDLDAIDHGGFVRAAANRLKLMAADASNADREIVVLALQRLYIEHLSLEQAGS